jgi:hypothetical protein
LVLAAFAAAWPEAAALANRASRVEAVEVAGRRVSCPNVRTRFDESLPNLGAAAPDERLTILNPLLLGRYSKTVQLFVFHHECGHHRVGASELRADCWAVGEGVRSGWLDRNGLAQVCRSFANAPASDTHPAGRSRCANLDRCFAAAEIDVARKRQDERSQVKAAALREAPKLVAGPRLVRTSVLR